MQEWYSISELLALKVPGLPASRRGLLDLAEAGRWDADERYCRKRDGRGGGNEYHIRLLPIHVQRHLSRQAYVEEVNAPPQPEALDDTRRDTLWNAYGAATDKQKQTAQERLELVRLVDGHMEEMALAPACDLVAREKGTPSATLQRWARQVRPHPRCDWLAVLVPQHSGGTRRVTCDPRAWEHLVADYLRMSEPLFRPCYNRLLEEAEKQGWGPIPPYKTLLRRVQADIAPTTRVLARKGEKALAQLFPSQRRRRDHLHSMHSVNADGHVFDVRVLWEDGTIGRPIIVGFQDIYSGMILSHRVSRTENAEVIRLAIGDMVESWGVPQHCYFDNGRAFMSKYLTGHMKHRFRFKVREEDPVGVLTQLNIEVHAVKPYHGQSKPIERAWRDLAEYIAKHPACEGAYTGKNTVAKPENYGTKAVPIQEFRTLVADQVRLHNMREGRSSHTAQGRSLWETFRASYETALVSRATEEQRRFCMMAGEGLTVHSKTAQIHLADNVYWSRELAGYAGRKVMVRFDPQNLHSDIAVYTMRGQFIDMAECIHAVGFDNAEAAREQARKWRAYLRAEREMLEAARRLSADQVARINTSLPEYEAISPAATQIVVGNTVRKTRAEQDADADAFARGVARMSGEVIGFPQSQKEGGE